MVVTYGEALVDMIELPDGRFAAVLGGSVCNFTLALARQEMAVTYLNPLSGDDFGQRLARHLGDAGVRLASAARSALPTSLAIVTHDASQAPSYVFHRQAVADRDITPERASALLPAAPLLFHSGGLALVPDDLEATLAIMRAARAAGALLSIDANLRPLVCADLPAYAAGVRRALAQAQLIKVSEEDLLHLGYVGLAPLAAARALLAETGAALIALTLGAQGAVLLSPLACVSLPAPVAIEVRDTVGCGDCFFAALIASLARAGLLTAAALAGAPAAALEPALRHAIAGATLNALREGCDPANGAEVAAFLAATSA